MPANFIQVEAVPLCKADPSNPVSPLSMFQPALSFGEQSPPASKAAPKRILAGRRG